MSIKILKKAGHILFLLWMLFISKISAQETSQLLFLPGVPQASLENPAIQNQSGKLAIGIPVLSGIYVSLNSNMAFDYLFSEDFAYDFHRYYDMLGKYGKIQGGTKVSIFFASLKHNEYTFSVSVSERGNANANFDREIVRFLRDGILDYYGENHNLGTAFFQFRNYKEVGIGIAKEIWDGFDVGIRPKILFGKYFLDSKDVDMLAETNTQYNIFEILPQGSYFMSGPLSYDESFRIKILPGDYFFQPKNLGFAFDAGIVFQSDNNIEWSAGLLDVGAIRFGHNIFDMKMARPFRYPRGNLFQSHTPKAKPYMEPWEALKQYIDSTSYLLEVVDAHKGMITLLPMKLNMAGKYRVSDITSIGISNQLTWYRRQPINMLSAFSHIRFGTRLELAGSLSLYDLSEIAPGFGTSFSTSWMQFFMSSNNILGFFYPSTAKHLNLCFGMNFLFDTQ